MVLMPPSAAINRITFASRSATAIAPSDPRIARPVGADNCAWSAGPPSPLFPADPVPASVVIIGSGEFRFVTARTTWFAGSASSSAESVTTTLDGSPSGEVRANSFVGSNPRVPLPVTVAAVGGHVYTYAETHPTRPGLVTITCDPVQPSGPARDPSGQVAP